jgi:hypothetical protein
MKTLVMKIKTMVIACALLAGCADTGTYAPIIPPTTLSRRLFTMQKFNISPNKKRAPNIYRDMNGRCWEPAQPTDRYAVVDPIRAVAGSAGVVVSVHDFENAAKRVKKPNERVVKLKTHRVPGDQLNKLVDIEHSKSEPTVSFKLPSSIQMTQEEISAEKIRKEEEAENFWLFVNQRNRLLVDLEFLQPGLQGNPLRVKGVLIRVSSAGCYINIRKFGVRFFDRTSGFESGKKTGLHFDPMELQRRLLEILSEELSTQYVIDGAIPHGWSRT